MALEAPYPELDEFLSALGAAGNISICIGWPIEVRRRFPLAELNGSQAEGLTIEELREVVRAFDVPTTLV